MAYATPTELADWMGRDDPPPKAEQRLRDASADVDDLLLTARYDVDGDGMPTDAAVAKAVSEAALHQAEYLVETGDPTGAGGRLASVKVDRVTTTKATDSRGRVPPRGYGERAVQRLRLAGLLPNGPEVVGAWHSH